MKTRESADYFIQELAKHGKHLVEIESEYRREINFEWRPTRGESSAQSATPWTVHTITKRGANMMHSFGFRISHAEASLANGIKSTELEINAANWFENRSEYSAEPSYIAKAALSTNNAIERFIAAVDEARSQMPWTDDTKIMDKDLWMWIPHSAYHKS